MLALMPRETRFFDCFEIASRFALESARAFDAAIRSGSDTETMAKVIELNEEKADRVSHQSIELLQKRFTVPFERRTIRRLVNAVDEVVDLINAAAQRLSLYRIDRKDLGWLAGLSEAMVEAVEHVDHALRRLSDPRGREEILIHCERVNQIENQVDDLLRETQAEMFHGVEDQKLLLQLRELCDLIEGVTDRCEDVAHVIGGIVLDFH